MPSNSIKLRKPSLAGQVFGRLTAIEPVGNVGHSTTWLCQCSCGGNRVVRRSELVRGDTRSCGCLRREVTVSRMTRHGRSRSPEWDTWLHIKQRCFNPKDISYHKYGGRGITMCDRWINSFEAFFEDMGPRPSPKHSIDRIDNNGNYEPENCRWATRIEQGSNKRNNRILEHNGQCKTVSEWARTVGISNSLICRRLKKGWPIHRCLSSGISSSD